MEGQSASAYLSWMLRSLCGINVARHVDVDGIRPESGLPSTSAQYMQLVDKARLLVRTLEVTTQALYDDGATIFIAVQALGRVELLSQRDRVAYLGSVELTAPFIRANCVTVAQTLENLLALGHDQAAISQGDYRNSIEWRMSRINMADGSIAALTSRIADMPGGDDEFVDMETAFAQPSMRIAASSSSMSSQVSTSMYNNVNQQPSQSSLDMSDRSRSDSVTEPDTSTWTQSDSMESTLIAPPSPDMGDDPIEDEIAPYGDEEDRALLLVIICVAPMPTNHICTQPPFWASRRLELGRATSS